MNSQVKLLETNMTKNLTNLLFLLTMAGYLLFLILRVILERNPIDPILLTGAFIFFPLVLWVCLFVFLLFIKIYKLVVPSSSLSSSPPSYFVNIGFKIIISLKQFTKNFHENIKTKFLGQFLTRWSVSSKISLGFFLNFCKNRTSIGNKINTIVLIFWLCSLVIYVWEILDERDLWLTLYIFSFNILLRFLIDIYLYLVVFENERLLKGLENVYFPIFTEDVNLNRFFYINEIFRNNFLLFLEYPKNQKLMKIKLWQIFSEMLQHNVNLHIVTDFVEPDYYLLKRLLRTINLVIFTTTFILLVSQELLLPFSDLLIVTIISTAGFLIFFFWLQSLKEHSSPDLVYRRVFDDLNHMGLTFQDWFQEIKDNLLRDNCDIKPEDLGFNWFRRKSLNQLHNERFSPKFEVLDVDEKKFLRLAQEGMRDWFFDELLNGRINLDYFYFDSDKEINKFYAALKNVKKIKT